MTNFASEHEFCWLCGERPWEPLQTHHIIGGTKGRANERCNLARLCMRCHGQYHGGDKRINLAVILWLKKRFDGEHYDRKRLAALRHQALPRAQRPPAEYRRSVA